MVQLHTAAFRTSRLSVVSLVMLREVFTISLSTSCALVAVVVRQHTAIRNKNFFIVSMFFVSMFFVFIIMESQAYSSCRMRKMLWSMHAGSSSL